MSLFLSLFKDAKITLRIGTKGHLDAIFPPLKWKQYCLIEGITLQRRKMKKESNLYTESFANFSEQLCVSALSTVTMLTC